MGRLRLGTTSVSTLQGSGIGGGEKPRVEIGSLSAGRLRVGTNSIPTVQASAAILSGKKPTLEVGDSSYGRLRLNTNVTAAIKAGAALLAGKTSTLELGNSLFGGGLSIDAIRNGLTHWMLDVLGGTVMEQIRRGSIDGAIYAVNAGGKIVIPQTDYGDKVSYIRGVWASATNFTWNGFYADPYSGDTTNYYASHTTVGSTTEITLNTVLPQGTQLQVYYLYETTQVVDRYTYVQSYPCLYKAYGGPYPIEGDTTPGVGKFSSAVDSDQMFVMACYEAYMQLGISRYKDLALTIINRLREYEDTSDYTYTDSIDYALWSRSLGWFYTVGDPKATLEVVPAPENNRILKVVSTASSYSIVGKIGAFDNMAGSNIFHFKFLGEYNGKLYLAEICNDANKLDTIDKRFYYAFVDNSEIGVYKSHPINRFRSRKNIVFSDLSINGIGGYKGATASQTVETLYSPPYYTESDLTHHYKMQMTWDFSTASPGDDYAGMYVTIPNTSEVSSSNYSNVNFCVITPVQLPFQVRVIVRDAVGIKFRKDVTLTDFLTRVTVNFSDMVYDSGGTGGESLTHPIDQVFFEAKQLPLIGGFLVYDVKFGSHDFLPSYNISLWQLRLPIGNHTVYFDDIGFNYTVIDVYKGTPFFSYQNSSAGKDSWYGPTYAGYVMPGIHHILGYQVEALTQLQFLKDAQDKYYSNYNTSPAPFMPVHTRTRQENTAYAPINTFTWNAPNNDTYWAGYIYRAFEQVARYYYYTGNTTAKTILDRWITFFNANITEDPYFPGIPKGYRPPPEFIVNTGTWNNNYFSPDFHALVIQGMIFKYWKDGDSVCNTWYRRLLDDLIYNRKAANGSYPQGSKTYGFHQGEVGKALGMLINGRGGATPSYSLTPTTDDVTAFEALYAYFVDNVGESKPCALSPEWIPLHQRETVTYGNNEKKWVINNAALTEGISICMYFAVDYAKYDNSDYGKKWLDKLYQFLYDAVKAGV